MIKQNIYRWHRSLSLIIAIPVLLWALSGFMHPLMTNIRPKLATQTIRGKAIDTTKIKISLEQALEKNHIDSFSSFRIVHIADNWFYQVQLSHGKEPVYLATLTGKALTAGNWVYSQWLSRQFLEGELFDNDKTHTSSMPAGDTHDCCDAATDLVINASRGAKVKDASLLTDYNSEYKSINRLLPVYRVAFERADGIRIYVDPVTDRFALAMNDRRRIFDRIFTLVHTWAWLDFLGKGKFIIEFILVGLAFITTLMGLYVFFTTRSKKVPGNKLIKARRNHRYTAVVVSLFTLMFSFSGAYHALSKLKDDDRGLFFSHAIYQRDAIHLDLVSLQQLIKTPIEQVGIVQIKGKNWWRIQVASATKPGKAPNDLMKSFAAQMPTIHYVAVDSNDSLPNGEQAYVRFLADQFNGRNDQSIVSIEPVTKFGAEYNFSDKRLPVWKVNYADGGDRLFIETATSSLAKRLSTESLAQDYSFSFLHKHEFLGWAGKGWKDFSTMFWAMAQVLMVGLGLVLYAKWRKNKNSKINKQL